MKFKKYNLQVIKICFRKLFLFLSITKSKISRSFFKNFLVEFSKFRFLTSEKAGKYQGMQKFHKISFITKLFCTKLMHVKIVLTDLKRKFCT